MLKIFPLYPEGTRSGYTFLVTVHGLSVSALASVDEATASVWVTGSSVVAIGDSSYTPRSQGPRTHQILSRLWRLQWGSKRAYRAMPDTQRPSLQDSPPVSTAPAPSEQEPCTPQTLCRSQRAHKPLDWITNYVPSLNRHKNTILTYLHIANIICIIHTSTLR